MKNENPTGKAAGKSSAEPSHDFSGGIHQKNKSQQTGWNRLNAQNAVGKTVINPPDGTPQVADRSKAFAAYSDKPQPKSPKEYPNA